MMLHLLLHIEAANASTAELISLCGGMLAYGAGLCMHTVAAGAGSCGSCRCPFFRRGVFHVCIQTCLLAVCM